MENKKDIGKAFREKLDGLHKPAPDGGWNSISLSLLQNKPKSGFQWFKPYLISLIAIIVALLATYPFWKEHVPHIYMEMPDEHKTGNDHDASKNQTTDKPDENKEDASEISVTDNEDRNDPGSTTVAGSSNALPSKGMQATPVLSSRSSNNDTSHHQDSNTAPDNGVDSKSVPVETVTAGNKTTNTATPTETTATKISDDEERMVKLLDLSGVSYGADTLKKSKAAKKLDTSRIADSLNKLYGREKKDKKTTRKN